MAPTLLALSQSTFWLADKPASPSTVPFQRSHDSRLHGDGSRRYYDLLDRLVPATVLGHDIHSRSRSGTSRTRATAHRLLGPSAGGDIFGGLGQRRQNPDWPGSPGRTALRQELIESGALVAVDVEGVRGKRYVLEDEVQLLEAPAEPLPSVAFLDRSIRSSGTEPARITYSGSSTSGTFTGPRDGVSTGTCSRSSSASGLSAGSSRASTGARASKYSVSGGTRLLGTPRDGFVDAMRDALDAYLRFAGVNRLDWPPHLARDRRLLPLAADAQVTDRAR